MPAAHEVEGRSGGSATRAEAPPLSVRRAFEAAGVAPFWVGVALAWALLAVFFVVELAMGQFTVMLQPGDPDQVLPGMRLAVAHILVAVYLVTAFVYAERTAERSLGELSRLTARSGGAAPLSRPRNERIALGIAGGLGVVAGLIASWISPGGASFRPSTWDPESVWHRVLALFIGFWIVRLLALIVIDSVRLSRLAADIPRLDLLDPKALAPVTRHGLTNALLWLGLVAVYALFLVEPGYLPTLLTILATGVIAAGAALVLPAWGARRCIQARKSEELAWCRERIRAARAALEEARPGTRDRLDELVAWEGRIERVRDWPFDSSTLTRFALYLLIPLASWCGAALVERMVDTLFD